ncbi:unnamed protein product [Blepharisma stoltei]|uniref:Metaxin glutathione S-transferase domain-containing protein n=1 Tax=Blepharisma stoltei TaxID=1481888 RepID=A0AAU9KAX7_9CILI|nr:unnamed protein product [Blepharisma stoltei]
MEQDLVIYKKSDNYDPVIQIVRCWVTLYQIRGYKECESGHNWNKIENLPVLRYEKSIFGKEHVLEFLKSAYDINFNLTEEEKKESSLMEELCISRINPATRYAMWNEQNRKIQNETGSNNFWSILIKLLENLGLAVKKPNEKESLKYQYAFSSEENSFNQVHQAHQLLSEKLGNQTFFFEERNRARFPRSADISIYAYLLEEFEYLHDHPHVTESLNSFPNLLSFVQRISSILLSSNQKKEIPEYSIIYRHFANIQEDEFYYPPTIQIKPYQESNWELIKYKFQDKSLDLKDSTKDTKRRIYVVSISAILFFIIYLKIIKH